MKKSTKKVGLVVVLLLFLCLGVSSEGASAQSETGYDLVAAVNALRVSYGLEPYTIDYWIMDYAQQHSQYQADTQTSTHTHSDGMNSLSQGLIENVAGGDTGYVTVDIVVNKIWVDWGHLNTMIGYESGQVGGGIAYGSNGTAYFTLNVRAGQQVSSTLTPGTPVAPSAPFQPIITSTPMPSGEIWHLVLDGETLWGIAVSYGVTLQSIRDINGMRGDESIIYPGDLLLIRTRVDLSGTETSPTSVPASPTPLYTATSTASPTPELPATSSPIKVESGVVTPESSGKSDILPLLSVILGSSGITLAVITFFLYWKKDQKDRE